MLGENPRLFGIYLNLTSLQKCVDCLKAIGVRASDVAVLLAATGSSRSDSGMRIERAVPSFLSSTTRISVPASGALTDTLINLGVPVYDAERYENRVHNGGVLMYVRCASPAWRDRVVEILKQTGAEDILLSRDAKPQIRVTHIERPCAVEVAIHESPLATNEV